MRHALGLRLCFLACLQAVGGCAGSHVALDEQDPPSSVEQERDPLAYGYGYGGAGTGAQPGASAYYEAAYDGAQEYAGDAPAAASAAVAAAAAAVAGDPGAAEIARGCPDVSGLAATDGSIEFQPDGSAVVSVTLGNTSDDDFINYPGLHVWWRIENSYQAGQLDDLLLYGITPHDRWEHVTVVPAERSLSLCGHDLVVQAEPFARSTGTGEECRSGEVLEFTARIPER